MKNWNIFEKLLIQAHSLTIHIATQNGDCAKEFLNEFTLFLVCESYLTTFNPRCSIRVLITIREVA